MCILTTCAYFRQDEATSIMVLLKFRATLDAEDFFKMYNGQPFDALDRSVTCQLVYVTAVTASQSATLPHAYPLLTHTEPWPIIPSEQSTHNSAMAALQPYRAHSGLRQEAYELPTCPVCLERLDARLSGLITVLCQHTFHCDCLERWTDSRCPVCRYAAAPMNKELGTADGFHTASSECVVCHTTSDLWVCLICANVGCGRYKQGHAQQHFQETGHLYSLEMQTQRVWDYAGDGYVHRLIQSSSGGKLVELPSASNAATLSDRLWNARYPSAVNRGSGSEHAYLATTSGADDIELLQEKMEALGLEYSNMILSQLDSQRVYYESRLATQRTELVPRSELLRAHEERDLARNALNEAHQRCDELAEQLAVSTTAETRRDAQLRRALEMGKQLRRELDEEKCVSDGLYKRVEQLQSEQTVLQDKVSELSDELRDLMFFVSARDKIDQSDEALGIAGGTAYVPEPSRRRK